MNRAGRTGGTFLHTSRTDPQQGQKAERAGAPAGQYQRGEERPDAGSPENLDWLGVDYLIPIGGDDTLSYGSALAQGRRQGHRHPEDDGQ